MFTAKDIINLFNTIDENNMVDKLYEDGLEHCIGKNMRETFFNRAYGMDVDDIIDEFSEALEKTDDECEPIVDEFITWLSEQPWFSDEDFEQIVRDEFLGNYVSGYRIVDGKVVNSDELEDC